MEVKKRLDKKDFYLSIMSFLKRSTNLTKLRKKLGIGKQNLNYYLKEMVKFGYLEKKGRGWYEVKSDLRESKNSTKYGNKLVKDMVRGHAYVWNVKLNKKPIEWKHRVTILRKKGFNFKLVGAKETTPRIKVLGRKVWLCNNHIRIFDTEKASYYGNEAKEAREKSTMKLYEIVTALENKLGFFLKPFEFSVQKEHYALIKNDLAIDHNKKGIIMRIQDENGEWLLIDDSLGEGGELETTGKKAYENNKPLQEWWNIKKKYNFEVTDDFILKNINKTKEQVKEMSEIIRTSSEKQLDMGMVIKQVDSNIRGLTETIYQLAKVVKSQSDNKDI